MPDETQKPSPGDSPPATPPEAAAEKPASAAAEPLKAEPSRSGAPGAGASAAPPKPPAPPTPKPASPVGATTATTAEASFAAPGAATPTPKPAAPKPAAAAAPKAQHKPAPPAPPPGPPDPPPPADVAVPPFITAVREKFGDAVRVSYWVGDWTIIVPTERLLEICTFLRDGRDTDFDFCSDVTASDWPVRAKRFDVIYCLYSIRQRVRLRVKTQAGEQDPVPSVTGIWPAANWLEREVYDLFGVKITGHPDLRRILMPQDWQGYPQRKDYPLEGPGEMLLENPLDWLRLRQALDEADIE